MRKIIAFGVWGSRPMYIRGAVANAAIAPRIFPGWTCRFYVDGGVDAAIGRQLRALPHAEVVVVPGDDPTPRTFWRYKAVEDADVLLVRDADSRFSRAEEAAVDAWLVSDKEVHSLQHNRILHPDVIFGGCIGLRGRALRDFQEALLNWVPVARYGNEEEFIRQCLLPIWKKRDTILIHEDTWGWGEPYPQRPVDAVGCIWFHNPGVCLQAFPRDRGRTPHTGLLPPLAAARPYKFLSGLLRPLHRGLSAKVARAAWPKDLPPPHDRAAYEAYDRLADRNRGILRLKKVTRSLEATPDWTGAAPDSADDCSEILASIPKAPDPAKGIIAFALPTADPALLRGALDNAEAAAAFYPGWTCRFYAHESVPARERKELARRPGVEVRVVAEAEASTRPAHAWGLAAAADCDVLLLRSPLARLTIYDRQAVYHWLASDCDLHSLHDHPDHPWHSPTPTLCGIRGALLAEAADLLDHRAPLSQLAKRNPGQWLRHDGQWHLGVRLPEPQAEPGLLYHGMPWELSDEYGGLPTPVVEHLWKWEASRGTLSFLLIRHLRSYMDQQGWSRRRMRRTVGALCFLLHALRAGRQIGGR